MFSAATAKYKRTRGATIFAGAVVLAASVACGSPTNARCSTPVQPADQTSRVSISQGVAGNVWEWVGAFPDCGAITAVSRTVLVYPPTPIPALGSGNDGSYWSSFPVAPLDSAKSDASGLVQLPLPPGAYSFVVRDSSGYYINLPSFQAGVIGAATVAPYQVKLVHFWITARAVF